MDPAPLALIAGFVATVVAVVVRNKLLYRFSASAGDDAVIPMVVIGSTRSPRSPAAWRVRNPRPVRRRRDFPVWTGTLAGQLAGDPHVAAHDHLSHVPDCSPCGYAPQAPRFAAHSRQPPPPFLLMPHGSAMMERWRGLARLAAVHLSQRERLERAAENELPGCRMKRARSASPRLETDYSLTRLLRCARIQPTSPHGRGGTGHWAW